MAGEGRDPNVLLGRDVIRGVLGVGRRRFAQLIELGLPVRKDGYSYLAHREEILLWWREYTDGPAQR